MLRGWFSPGGGRGRVVRSPAAGADPSRHAAATARRDPAGFAGGLHAVPVRVAAPRRRRRSCRGLDGLRAVIAQLDGFELAADAWDKHVLPARVDGYDPSMLDLLCYSGEAAWARVTAPPAVSRRRCCRRDRCAPRRSRLFLRDHAPSWRRWPNSIERRRRSSRHRRRGPASARPRARSSCTRSRRALDADAGFVTSARRIGMGRSGGVRWLRRPALDVERAWRLPAVPRSLDDRRLARRDAGRAADGRWSWRVRTGGR